MENWKVHISLWTDMACSLTMPPSFLSFFFCVQVNVCVFVSGVGSHGSIEHELRIQHLLARAQRVNQPKAGVYNPVSQSSALFLSLTRHLYPAIIWTSNMYINRSQLHETRSTRFANLFPLQLQSLPWDFNDHLVVHLMNETSTLTEGSVRKLKPNTMISKPCPLV